MMKRGLSRLITFLMLLFTSIGVSNSIAHPGAGIAVTADGRVFFVDTGGGIFSIERDRRVIRHEGPALHWFAFDPDNRFKKTPWPSIPGAELCSIGADPTLVLSSDFPVTVGTDGAFYYPAKSDGGRISIVRIDPSGSKEIKTILPPVQSNRQTVAWLNGLAAGSNGSLYYTEDSAVRKVDSSNRVSDFAKDIVVPSCASIPGIGAELRPYLRGLAVAPDGSVYVAATGCGVLLKIDARGEVRTVLRTTPPWSPTAVAIAQGEVYVLEYLHTASDDRREWLPRVRMVSRTGGVTTLGTSNRR